MPTESSPEPATQLTRMLGRPFGTDERGQAIDHGNGRLILGAIDELKAVVGQKAAAGAPDGISRADRDALVRAAEDEAVDRLITMLNEAIGEPRYHVSREYLLNERNRYSYEFRLFVYEYCRVISGHDDFFRSAGARSIHGPVALITRPLGIQRTYAVLPALVAKFVKTDIRVTAANQTSAIIQWHGSDQVSLVPQPHRKAYIRYACEAYKGGFAGIPRIVFGLPSAEVRELRCQADGAECCEWEFTWIDAPVPGGRLLVAAGAVASALLAGAVIAGLPGELALGLLGACAPLGIALQWRARRQVLGHRAILERQLGEERDLAEREVDESERTNAKLQVANLELTRRISELTTLHESALALSSTLDVDQVLDQSLDAIVRHLGYDRALAMLADDEHRVLRDARARGGTEEMNVRIDGLELSYDLEVSQLVRAFHADAPMLFEDVDQDPHEGNRALAQALGAKTFICAPLVTKGRKVGIVAVDNALSGRALDASDLSLLMTLGRQVAAAIETARLYGEVEAHNRTLEERVDARTAELQRATTELERELAERRRLRDRELQYLDQVNKVVMAAAAVEDDKFNPRSLDETAGRDDELGQLARTFRRMAEHMIAREQSLQREVADLRIEIDTARQAKQVAEIVETEYFRSLRSQARDLRRIAGMK